MSALSQCIDNPFFTRSIYSKVTQRRNSSDLIPRTDETRLFDERQTRHHHPEKKCSRSTSFFDIYTSIACTEVMQQQFIFMLHFHEKGSFDPTAQMSLFVELQLIKYIRNNSKRTFPFISVISHTFSSDSHCSHLLRSGFANGGTRVPNVNYLSSSKSTLPSSHNNKQITQISVIAGWGVQIKTYAEYDKSRQSIVCKNLLVVI